MTWGVLGRRDRPALCAMSSSGEESPNPSEPEGADAAHPTAGRAIDGHEGALHKPLTSPLADLASSSSQTASDREPTSSAIQDPDILQPQHQSSASSGALTCLLTPSRCCQPATTTLHAASAPVPVSWAISGITPALVRGLHPSKQGLSCQAAAPRFLGNLDADEGRDAVPDYLLRRRPSIVRTGTNQLAAEAPISETGGPRWASELEARHTRPSGNGFECRQDHANRDP